MRSSSVNRSGDCSGGKPIFYGKTFHGALIEGSSEAQRSLRWCGGRHDSEGG